MQNHCKQLHCRGRKSRSLHDCKAQCLPIGFKSIASEVEGSSGYVMPPSGTENPPLSRPQGDSSLQSTTQSALVLKKITDDMSICAVHGVDTNIQSRGYSTLFSDMKMGRKEDVRHAGRWLAMRVNVRERRKDSDDIQFFRRKEDPRWNMLSAGCTGRRSSRPNPLSVAPFHRWVDIGHLHKTHTRPLIAHERKPS